MHFLLSLILVWIVTDSQKFGVYAHLDLFEEGGRGASNPIPDASKNGFPGDQWPKLLVDWLRTLEETR
jgi:hypothetical protein